IGSLPGVVGLSGMQVKGPLPSRSTFILPCASTSMMVASWATAFGAADIAFAIFSLSVLGGVCLGWAVARPTRARTVTRLIETLRSVMDTSCGREHRECAAGWIEGTALGNVRHRSRRARAAHP